MIFKLLKGRDIYAPSSAAADWINSVAASILIATLVKFV